MSQFYDQASLVMVPSGYKDGKLYSQKPLSTSGELSFSRGSDIEATRVNSQGYIEKAQVNLLLQSNQFDTTWANTNTTETGGQADKDGGTTAWKIDKSGTSGNIYQNVTASGVFTQSVYAKAGTLNWMVINNSGTTSNSVYFDLANGVLGTVQANAIDAKIESIGGGWYRCSMTLNTTSSNMRIYPADADGDVSGTSGNIYIQDAQLNYGLVAQDYVETTTAAVVSGITNDMPRLNYDPANPTCPSLLLEPSRTNLIANSEYFNGSNWSLSNATSTENTAISPEGVQNASTFTTTVAGADLRDALNVTGTYTFSAFVKLVDVGGVRLRIDAATDANAFFDLSDGSVSSSDGIITADAIDYGNNWWRVYMVANVTNTQKFQIFTTDGSTSYANGSVYLYGVQIELGSHPTSLVPTYGASATRTADACSKTGISSLIGQTEGTLFCEVEFEDITNTNAISVNSGTSDRAMIYTTSGNLTCNVRVSGVSQFGTSTTIATNTKYKAALAYKANDFAFYVNGVQIATHTSGSVPATSDFSFNTGTTGAPFNGIVNQTLVFKTRLSNADLATLTTL